MNLLGLDLGNFSVKFVEIEKKRLPTLVSFGAVASPTQSIFTETPEAESAYSNYLANFLSDHKVSSNQTVISLPESSVFTKIIPFPKMDEGGIKKAIELGSEQYIPLPAKEASIGFEILGESLTDPGKLDVFVVASQKKNIEKIIKVLKKSHLEVVGVETEMMALVRSLLSEADLKAGFATVLLNIGSVTSDLAIVYSGGIRFTRSISSGGVALTRAVAQDLGFDINQAEEYKKSYGLDPSFLEGRISKTLKPIFDVTLSEVKRSVAFFSSRNQGIPVRRLILSGGTAFLPGVLAYIATEIGLEAELADCWKKIDVPSTFSASELSSGSANFAVAAGLALKEF